MYKILGIIIQIVPYLMGLGGGALFIFFAANNRSRWKYAMELQQTCTVEVDGVCTDVTYRRAGRRGDYNATYQYVYNGQYYTANNGIWYDMFSFDVCSRGQQVKLMIDPHDPQRVYDKIAARAAFNGKYGSIYTAVIGVLIALIPVFQHLGITLR